MEFSRSGVCTGEETREMRKVEGSKKNGGREQGEWWKEARGMDEGSKGFGGRRQGAWWKGSGWEGSSSKVPPWL